MFAPAHRRPPEGADELKQLLHTQVCLTSTKSGASGGRGPGVTAAHTITKALLSGSGWMTPNRIADTWRSTVNGRAEPTDNSNPPLSGIRNQYADDHAQDTPIRHRIAGEIWGPRLAIRARRAPRPTVVLLVRHGRTPTTGSVLPGRAPDLHLSDEGLAQAEAVAERIGALAEGDRTGPTAVYASPLERTFETAKPIARRLGLRVRSDRGLLECDFGAWTGQQLSVLAKKPEWNQVQRFPSGFRFPGGESFAEMQVRITSALSRLVGLHPGETIVAVSHADPIKAAAAAAAGTHLDLFQRLVVSPCSVTAIAYSESGPYVLSLNGTASLSELAIS